jgi:tRNA-2-methylthio-N6-dimethylallyladenosine synthase
METLSLQDSKELQTKKTKGKAWIHTFGCQMNVHDSERMMSLLSDQGYSPSEGMDDADLVLFNSCSIREKAAHKLYSMLGELKKKKKEKPSLKVGVGGCVAVTEAQKIMKKNPHVNFIIGTDTIDEIPEILHRLDHGEDHIVLNRHDRTQRYSTETKLFWNRPQAFVNIQKGCDKFCTFCIVPFTRGREKSRTIQEVTDDVRNLVENKGVKEVTLLGQTVNSYGRKNKESFSDLLRSLDEIEGLKRVRYTSPHPQDATDDLIECHAELRTLVNHMHLPLQAGSDRVLKLMNRPYTVERYLSIVEKARQKAPHLSITTDIIVGFPGETEKDFEETMKLLSLIRYDTVYSFVYSSRSGTKAAKMDDPVSYEEKKKWLHRLQARQTEIQEQIMKDLVGKRFEILVEGTSKNNPNALTGRTTCNRVINFESPRKGMIHRFVDVEVVKATAHSLQGMLV